MLVSPADVKTLKRRRQALHDHIAFQHAELLRELCVRRVIELLSDGVAAHRACPAAACRRRRRCRGLPYRCISIIAERGIAYEPVHLIDALYWSVLQRVVDEDGGRS